MALLTTFCQRCDRIALSDEREASGGRLQCGVCPAPVRIVPGCSFGPGDIGLFKDVLEAVVERNVRAAEARALAASIAATVGAAREDALLESMTGRFPGLLAIQVAAGANAEARRRALRLLRAILEACTLRSPET